MRGWDGGGEGAGGGSRGEWEEGKGRKIEKKGREVKRGKFCVCATPRREEGEKGQEWEVREGRGLSPVHPLINVRQNLHFFH